MPPTAISSAVWRIEMENLTVPISGRYFIYAQIYYYNNNGRVHIRVNSKVVTLISPMKSSNSEGTLYTGGVFRLKAGDVITMTTSWPTAITKVWMGKFHCFLGAFFIWSLVVIFGRRLNALSDSVRAEVKHWVVRRIPLELDAGFLSIGRHLGLGFISIMSWFQSEIKRILRTHYKLHSFEFRYKELVIYRTFENINFKSRRIDYDQYGIIAKHLSLIHIWRCRRS